jgi:hypothetical protein
MSKEYHGHWQTRISLCKNFPKETKQSFDSNILRNLLSRIWSVDVKQLFARLICEDIAIPNSIPDFATTARHSNKYTFSVRKTTQYTTASIARGDIPYGCQPK